MQKHVDLVDLVKSFPTNIFLQNLASIQKRTGPLEFAHLAENSEKGSTSNLSTKVPPRRERLHDVEAAERQDQGGADRLRHDQRSPSSSLHQLEICYQRNVK